MDQALSIQDHCERCGNIISCTASDHCFCHTIHLNLNEMQYVSELYKGCLCLQCLADLKTAYAEKLTD